MDNDSEVDNDLVKKTFAHVRVLHNFRASNNDELCLKKDDIITLTQTPSGGWWEGTLDGTTGWFPANYITPVLPTDPIYPSLIHGHGHGYPQSCTFVSSSDSIPLSPSGSSNGTIYGQRPMSRDNNNVVSGPPSLNQSILDEFISNNIDPTSNSNSITGTGNNSVVNGDNLAEYRSIVIKDIEDSEKIFIQNLQDSINLYLKPLYHYKIFPTELEINTVLRSITEICTVHRRFLNAIDKIKSQSSRDSRIGGIFMQFAPQFKLAHVEYCSHHARFVHLIEKYKNEICSLFVSHQLPIQSSQLYHQTSSLSSSPSHSATVNSAVSMPNVLITSSLSVSFRRLDKYPALLQELQRYTEENHVDRGDTQRAGFLFREIAMFCLELRRRKEMELEVMLGNIRNFDGLKIESYGNILKMEPAQSVLILPPWSEPKKDCYLVLFPRVLMILSVGNEMTSFSYESMLELEQSHLQVIQPGLLSTTGSSNLGAGIDYRLEISGQSGHPLSESGLILTYQIQLSNDEIWKEWRQTLQRQIRSLNSDGAMTPPPSGELGPGPSGSGSGNSSCSSGSIQQLSASNHNSASSPPCISSTTSSDPILSPLSPPPGGAASKPPISGSKMDTGTSSSGPPPPVPPSIHNPRIQIVSSPKIINAIASTNLNKIPPTTSANSSATTAMIPERTSFWSEHILTSHAPYRPYDNHNHKSLGTATSGGGGATIGTTDSTGSAASRTSLEQQNEDLQLLNVIDSYYRKLPINSSSGGGAAGGSRENVARSRKLSNSNMTDISMMTGMIEDHHQLEPYQMIEVIENAQLLQLPPGARPANGFKSNQSTARTKVVNRTFARNNGKTANSGANVNSLQTLSNKLNKLSLSAMDRDILYEIYDQLRLIRKEMFQLDESLRDERRHRKRLQEMVFQTVKR